MKAILGILVISLLGSAALAYGLSAEFLFKFDIESVSFGVSSNSTHILVANSTSIAIYNLSGIFEDEFKPVSSPRDVAINSTHIFVMTTNNDVELFNLSGNPDSSPFNSADIFAPLGIAINSTHVFVADDLLRIGIFNLSGNLVGSIPTDGNLIDPSNVAIDSNGRIIVADDGGPTAIDIYDSSGVHITSFGTITTPRGIDVDSNNRIIVSDAASSSVLVFDSSGNLLTTFGSSGTGNGEFGSLSRLTVDSNDRIIVADVTINRIQVFTYTSESSTDSTCHVPPTFGTPFTCAIRNFVDNGITIHRVSYDPTNELHIENPQINAVVGLPYSIKLAPYDSEGQSNIKWVAVSIGLVEGDFVFGNGQALAYLHQSYDGTFTVEEDDPTDVIEVMSFSKVDEQQCAVSDNDAMCPIYELKYKYREAPIDNMVGVQVVNQDGESENRFFNDGIDVTGDSMNPSPVIEVIADEKFVAKHYLTFVDPSFKDRTVAVDENGIIWNKVGNFWTTEHLMPDRACGVSTFGFARTCPEFTMQVQGQELLALNTLDTMYPNINRDEPFSELNKLNKILAYEYPTTSQRELTSLQKILLDWYNVN